MEKNAKSIYEKSNAIDIEFEDLSFTVKRKKDAKKIIKGVSGKFKSGELTAIMGPSGAGKTSLLNILTGYQVSGVEGTIGCVSGGKRKTGCAQYKKHSCYILQDDHLPDYLTVAESMRLATRLKISRVSKQVEEFLINDILTTIGLYTSKNTPCGNLSGGQKKRLSIALELVDDPLIMFLDEPTTGLDSSSANQCVSMLNDLAKKGRTIVCTIHQPSTPLYVTFSHVYVMADGRCAFQGSPTNTVPYLASVGFVCPQYHNPADFLLEVTSGEHGDSIELLSKAASDPKWRSNILSEEIQLTEKEMEVIATPTGVVYYEDDVSYQSPSELTRFFILLRKQMVYLNRDWTVSKLKILLHFLVGIFLGLNFQKCGYDASKVITNVSFFMCSVVYVSYTALMPSVLRYPSELSLIKKEHFNRWYKLKTYYIAHMVTDIPMQILFALIYQSMSYVISSQPLEISRFLMVFVMLSMVGVISSAMGLMFGTLVNPINGTFFAAVTTALMFSFAGFLCLIPHMSKAMYFLTNFSYMSYCMDGLMQAAYGHNRSALICPEEEEICLYTVPSDILNEIGMDKLPFWANVGYMVLNAALFRFLAYCSLRRKIKSSC
ncbi:ATP-binding cassette subfamily G member 4-like [Cylas formicarius]|uniref:ATP-binding cassette subfamily G member 4-like n=1 Tax=Cylas formicarius TaxID=197179 RepID=UPI002958B3F4|nr:ATP-binding cassette subfamily G member 4-like [Cylas formicarius]